MKTRLIGFAAAAGLTGLAALLTAPSLAQPQAPDAPGTPAKQEFVWPARLSNAKVLPADIGADRLRNTMVSFSRSLGVRCTFCHVGAEGAPLSQLDFVSDANPHKNIARGMLRMNQRINGELLPAVLGPVAQGAPARVTCFTCHRGQPHPATQPPAAPGAPGATPPAPAHPPGHHPGERG